MASQVSGQSKSSDSADKFVPWEPYPAAVAPTTKPASSAGKSSNQKRDSFFRTIQPIHHAKMDGNSINWNEPEIIPYQIKTIVRRKSSRRQNFPDQNELTSNGSNSILKTDSNGRAGSSAREKEDEEKAHLSNGADGKIEPNLLTPPSSPLDSSISSLNEKYQQLRLDYEKLLVENKCLKNEIGIQSDTIPKCCEMKCCMQFGVMLALKAKLKEKVNAELKRLVVASMGEDLQSHLDSLSNDKVRLAQEVVNYGQKLSQGHETLESLAIQSDMWRSKYLASSVMVDELVHWRVSLVRKFEEAQSCILRMMEEHHVYREHSFQTFLLMTEMLDVVNNSDHRGHSRINKPCTLYDLVSILHSLAQGLNNRLLEGKERIPPDINPQHALTPTEKLAQTLCSLDTSEFYGTSPCRDLKEKPAERQARLLGLTAQCQFKNLTINCCSQCAGEIKLV